MLAAMAGLEGGDDPQFRQAWAKLDGGQRPVCFASGLLAFPMEQEVGADSRGLPPRGLKHLVTTVGTGGPIHSGTTDVWLVIDGVNVRGAVVLAETPKSVTLVTVRAISARPTCFHLRGHFGIPQIRQRRTGI